MSNSFAFIDAVRNWIVGLDSSWVWSAAIMALAYALFDHKDTLDEVRAAQGRKKAALKLKLLVLWAVPVSGLIGAYAASVNSQKMEVDFSDATNRLAQAEITVAELKSKTAARRLSEEEKITLLQKLHPSAGESILLQYERFENEVDDFAGDFVEIFRRAGYRVKDEGTLNLTSPRPPPGITVLFERNPEPSTARLLLDTLSALGYEYTERPTRELPNVIWIKIGSKP